MRGPRIPADSPPFRLRLPAPSDTNMPPRITLRDIARRSGVHVSTVSLALRNSPRLSGATRGRIQEAAKTMGYVHDSVLDALLAYRDTARRRTHPTVLAYVTSWKLPLEEISHHRLYWRGARRRAEELGYKLEHFSLAEAGMTDARLGSILEARGITGLVLGSFETGSQEVKFDWSKISAVRIELQPVRPLLSTTAVDHIRAIMTAMDNACALGYRRPGFMLGHDWSELVEDHWKMGFEWAQRGLDPQNRLPIFLFSADWKYVPRQYRFESWFQDNRPDVLIGPHFHIEARLGDLDLKVPESVAVIDPFLETAHPFYAGVLHNFEEVGAKAIDSLVVAVTRNERGVPSDMVRSYITGRWCAGESCPPVRALTEAASCSTI